MLEAAYKAKTKENGVSTPGSGVGIMEGNIQATQEKPLQPTDTL